MTHNELAHARPKKKHNSEPHQCFRKLVSDVSAFCLLMGFKHSVSLVICQPVC